MEKGLLPLVVEIDLGRVREICFSEPGRYKLVGHSHSPKKLTIVGDDIDFDLNFRTLYLRGDAQFYVSGNRIRIYNGTIRANMKRMERGVVVHCEEIAETEIKNLRIYFSYTKPVIVPEGPGPAPFCGVRVTRGKDSVLENIHIFITGVARDEEPPTKCPCET